MNIVKSMILMFMIANILLYKVLTDDDILKFRTLNYIYITKLLAIVNTNPYILI